MTDFSVGLLYTTVSVTAPFKTTLKDRLRSERNLSVKWSITIGTMINVDSEFNGHGNSDIMCKQALTLCQLIVSVNANLMVNRQWSKSPVTTSAAHDAHIFTN